MGVGQPPGGVCCDTSLFRIRLVRQVRASHQWPGGVSPGGSGGDADGIVRAGVRACFACRSMVWRPAFCVPCHTDICRAGCSSAVHQPLQRAAMAITACCAVTCSALRFSHLPFASSIASPLLGRFTSPSCPHQDAVGSLLRLSGKWMRLSRVFSLCSWANGRGRRGQKALR